ncbi:hypothetical protein PYCCODRAFT_1367457 [Trametes coccinea BRFM310]|uniref:Uncharacterized protein n=1 Tax=Trametes coccinea (strain BRFM310) TaxID=1353009 RepID=A0A1Y2IMZ3_TRAC3|nr:hypothetical protein PYCCODRAFT_1367457 [Trametes coccinea BRFM310]
MLKPTHTFALFFTFTLCWRVFAGNTTCASGQLDWYTSVVGETPCMTYQRLRQICNGDYQVGNFRSRNPGDNCDDQVSGCCCNTIAFELSMLCMNCQQDLLPGDQVGIDAAPGTYTEYRGNCGAGTNNSLPSDIQAAVCNENIRLDNYLYGGWGDGSFVYTRENAEKDHAANNNNTFTHCPNQKAPVETTSSTTTTTTTSSSTSTSQTQPTVTGAGLAPVSQPNSSVTNTVTVSGASSQAGSSTTTTGTTTTGSSARATSSQSDSSAADTTSSQVRFY